MNARERLPNRRASESFTFELGVLRFTATVSRFPDGRIRELFLNNHKAGNQSDTNARDAAILLSFALQYGADIDAVRRALCRDGQGRALGPIGAALDLVAGMSLPIPLAENGNMAADEMIRRLAEASHHIYGSSVPPPAPDPPFQDGKTNET